jgi:hypothetical protein
MDNDDKRNKLNTRIYKVCTELGDVSNDHEYNRKLIKRVNGEEIMIENCDMFMSLFAQDFCKGDRAEATRVFHSVDKVMGWTL